MDENFFIRLIKRRVAQISVGSSALRNQGGSGLIEICRDHFENQIDLKSFSEHLKNESFPDFLDTHTSEIVKKFPNNAKSWGAARKGLNLFFRDVSYNLYLCRYLQFPLEREENTNLLKQLEVPLDKDVGIGLSNMFSELPKWKSIKELKPSTSKLYQNKAADYATELSIARIHLDLIFWRKLKK